MQFRTDWVLDEDPALCSKEGFRAFVKQVGRGCHNPYRPGSTAHNAFHAGWQFGRCSFSLPANTAGQPKKAEKPASQLRQRSSLPILRPH